MVLMFIVTRIRKGYSRGRNRASDGGKIRVKESIKRASSAVRAEQPFFFSSPMANQDSLLLSPHNITYTDYKNTSKTSSAIPSTNWPM